MSPLQGISSRSHRLRLMATMIVSAALLAGLIAGAGLAILQNSETSGRACGAALRVRNAMTVVLKDAKRRTESTPARTPREHEQASDFYAKSLRTLNAVRCDK